MDWVGDVKIGGDEQTAGTGMGVGSWVAEPEAAKRMVTGAAEPAAGIETLFGKMKDVCIVGVTATVVVNGRRADGRAGVEAAAGADDTGREEEVWEAGTGGGATGAEDPAENLATRSR